MNFLSVDGVELSLPMGPETPLRDLLQFLRETLVTERALISLIRIDGNEMNLPSEQEMALTPLSALDSIEIYTSHPRELADETLQHLIEYSHIIENISRSSAILIDDLQFHEKFLRLIEGIATFTEAITEVKKILKVRLLQSVNLLEADLLSILTDLLDTQVQVQKAYLGELLGKHLPENLQQWREVGIPDLIRSRDS